MLYKFENFQYIKESRGYSTDEVEIIRQYFLSVINKNFESVVVDSLQEIGNVFDVEKEHAIAEYICVGLIEKHSNLLDRQNIKDNFIFNKYDSTRDIERCFSSLLNGGKFLYTFTTELYSLEEITSKKRYERYLTNSISQKLDSDISVASSILNINLRDSEGKYKVLISILDNLEFVNPLNSKNCLKYIKNKPDSLESLGKYVSNRSIIALINKNPSYEKFMGDQERLNYIKYKKSKTNPERSQMENDSQMYVFASKPLFKKNKSGSYDKDIEVERMVPIDPYNASDGFTLQMMKMRASMQGDTKVYCIWLPKDAYSEEQLDKINTDEFAYLRNSINDKKERI